MASTIFEQLAPYAGMTVVPGVTVGRLAYANQQTTFSDAVFTADASGNVAANTELAFFRAAVTETGQGWTSGLTLSQTNSKFSKGQPPANQCLVATTFGVGVYYTDDLNPANSQDVGLPNSLELFALLTNFSWDLQIGNGITRTIGSLMEYPDIGGTWSAQPSTTIGTVAPVVQPTTRKGAQNGMPACYQVKLPIPIIFPPLINVNISAKNGNAFTIATAASANIVVRVSLGGFLMTMPV